MTKNNDTALLPYRYAPGDYQSKCIHCEKLFTGDKRARCCKSCAEVMLERDNTRSTAPQNAALEALDKVKLGSIDRKFSESDWFLYHHSATIRAALNQPRTVKPLVWEKQLEQLVAKVPFDREYAIIKVGGKFTLYFPEAGVYRVNFGSEDDAKAAAEAHWQQKIGECLG